MDLHCNFTNKHLISPPLSSFSSSSYFKFPKFICFYFLSPNKLKTSFVRSISTSNHQNQDSDSNSEEPKISKKLSEQSSWEAKDSEGNDYLYRLGKESDNMNIAVGARAGVIDDLFAGKFLGRDSDIVFDYRQKATRSFEYLQGDYYIAPAFMDKVGKFSQSMQM